jgi:pimeloyl-ACP methyl ester carboxylesterase
MALIGVNGRQINVEDTGPPPGLPDAPVLVMGHGLLFSTTMWRHQVEAWRSTYRCVRIDWHGQGATPEGPADMDSLYADLAAVIEHLAVGPVHYLGLSMGGMVGQRLAARRPDLVRSLTLIDTSAGPEDPDNVGRYRLLATAYGLIGLGPLRGQVAPIMFTPAFLGTERGREVVRVWLQELSGQNRRATKKAIRGVTDRLPVIDELGAVTAPTLVVVGTGDVATPVAKAETIAGAIAGATLVKLEGVGHVSTLEAPDQVTAAITPFLAAH